MIPVILPYHRTHFSDDSLRYALRSLERITGIGQVFIIGDEPAWQYQNLTVIRCDNAYHNDAMRDANIYYKMKLGFEQVSDKALVMHDDNFFLSYSGVEDWPWYVGDVPTPNGGLYKNVIENTYDTFGDIVYSDVHCAHVIGIKKFNQLNALDWTKPPGYCIKSLCNEGSNNTYITDLKLKGYQDAEDIRVMIKGRPWFSAADNAFGGGGLRKVLNELYPLPSKYEA